MHRLCNNPLHVHCDRVQEVEHEHVYFEYLILNICYALFKFSLLHSALILSDNMAVLFLLLHGLAVDVQHAESRLHVDSLDVRVLLFVDFVCAGAVPIL